MQQLLDSGQAYRTTAGPEEVKAFKEANDNRGFRGADEGEGAVRLRMPDEGVTIVNDIDPRRDRVRERPAWTTS